MIGTFGDIVFETNDKKILTFSGFSYSAAGRWKTTETIGGVPKKEFLGADTKKITFDIQLNASFGVNPSRILKQLEEMTLSGNAYPLFIGGKPVGIGTFYWILASVSEAWDVILNDGKLLKASASLSLEEYQ